MLKWIILFIIVAIVLGLIAYWMEKNGWLK
jgi:hypothetical protein